MIRKMVIGANLGAILGTLASILMSVAVAPEDGPDLGPVKTALIFGGVWMSMGAMIGSLAAGVTEEGATLGAVFGGFFWTLTSCFAIGFAWSLFGCLAQDLLLVHSSPWGMNNNDPNLAIWGTFVIASGSGIGAAGAGFPIWAGFSWARRRRQCRPAIFSQGATDG